MSTLNPAEIRKLKKLADDGDSEAAWTLAMHYGRERESTLFNEHVTRAAELGLLEAQVILAVGNSCMSTGIRMEEDEVFSEHVQRTYGPRSEVLDAQGEHRSRSGGQVRTR